MEMADKTSRLSSPILSGRSKTLCSDCKHMFEGWHFKHIESCETNKLRRIFRRVTKTLLESECAICKGIVKHFRAARLLNEDDGGTTAETEIETSIRATTTNDQRFMPVHTHKGSLYCGI